ncbi:cell division control protein Cdc6 [Eremomyces bilateralis CBS 781.70]|uniref:Cell division control protein n=1 Tax=Eremomyces bilateralis CBS 781.70 TaxID=1392243 RepID=A0A6G1GCP6_9PEZI|nr:cell division control protein Cdc6 [Eremomyces bilateralis CBS 781.70]KAF1815857.1 cell division control protein Cdc6 [Eremomyces bilateralis CBS 781.70]
MASSVLGKRSRSTPTSKDAGLQDTGRLTRSKRAKQFVIQDNDENENPFVKSNDQGHQEPDEKWKLRTRKRSRGEETVPSKHGAPETRISINSPAKDGNVSPRKADSVLDPQSTFATPTTNRHKDAFATDPITPRHRVTVVGKPLTPRTHGTPTTPRTTAPNIYNKARLLFARSIQPGRLVGRDHERQELQDFIASHTSEKMPGSLYISGPPGTGKSALVTEVFQDLHLDESIKSATINCVGAKTSKDIIGRIFEKFEINPDVLTGSELQETKKLFHKRKTVHLVVLDEIDHLVDVDQDFVHTLFEWSLQKTSNLILIGIANALDFTDRFLPRLKSRALKPQLLPFMPYSEKQLSAILTAKLKTLMPDGGNSSHVPLIHPTAIMFLAKKVASQTGDLRRAFDLARRAVDLVETETRTKKFDLASREMSIVSPVKSPSRLPLVDNMNLSSPYSPSKSARKPAYSQQKSSLSDLTAESAPRATIAHIARVTAAAFSNGASSRLRSLNLQQKAVLCSLAAIDRMNKEDSVGPNAAAPASVETVIGTPSRHGRAAVTMPRAPHTPSKHRNGTNGGAPTVASLYSTYSALCRSSNILAPLSATEFGDVVSSLDMLSLISITGGKGFLTPTRTTITPSRTGRGKAFEGLGSANDERRVVCCVGYKEVEGCCDGAGQAVLKGILHGDMF